MGKFGLLAVVALIALAGCQTTEIGKNETNKAFPTQSQEDLEAALAKEGKLEEYRAAQERDRLYQQQGQQGSQGEQGSGQQGTSQTPPPAAPTDDR